MDLTPRTKLLNDEEIIIMKLKKDPNSAFRGSYTYGSRRFLADDYGKVNELVDNCWIFRCAYSCSDLRSARRAIMDFLESEELSYDNE